MDDDKNLQKLTETLEDVATAVESFTRKQTREMEDIRGRLEDHGMQISEVRRGLEKIETKMSRPGAAVPAGSGSTSPGGTAVPVIRMVSTKELEKRNEGPAGAYRNGFGMDERMTLADFVRGVAGVRTTDEVKAALNTGTDSAGGYAVPDTLMPGILQAMVPVSSLLTAGARVVKMDEGAKTVRTIVTENLPVAGWRNELGQVPEAEPSFRAVEAVPRSLACVIRISRELLMDAVGVDDALYTAISQGFAKEIDRVGLRGSGSAPEPRGILNTTGVNAVDLGANGAALDSYGPILSGMQAVREQNCPMPTAAIMSPRSAFALAGLEDANGQPIERPDILRSLRFIDTSQIPNNLTVGSSTDCSEIYVGDFSQMYFLFRESLSVQMLRETYAGTGEIGLLCHARLDVVIPYPKAFAVVKGVRP